MTINTNNLINNWNLLDYDCQALIDAYLDLKNGIYAFYQNGLITKEKMEAEQRKLKKAFDTYGKKFED